MPLVKRHRSPLLKVEIKQATGTMPVACFCCYTVRMQTPEKLLAADEVSQKLRDWQPTAQERAWEAIGWAPSLLEAQRLSKKENRLVFLFTLDGRMQRGRC